MLTSALAAILLLSLAAHAMPISQGAPRPGVATSPVRDEDLNVHRRIDKRSICPGEAPSDVIDRLKQDESIESKLLHPMFLISEMAEMLHRKRYRALMGNYCTSNQEALELIKTSVFSTVLGYLNNSGVPSENDVGCPPSYNITYYPDRYPRYLVHVECRNTSSVIVPRTEVQCPGSADMNTIRKSRTCESYHLGDMMYLTTSPSANTTILCSPLSDTEWYKCRATSVGVGCRFGDAA